MYINIAEKKVYDKATSLTYFGMNCLHIPDYNEDVFKYFWYTVFITLHVCEIILWPLRFSWLLVLGLYKEDYLQIFKCVSFWLLGFCG